MSMIFILLIILSTTIVSTVKILILNFLPLLMKGFVLLKEILSCNFLLRIVFFGIRLRFIFLINFI